MAKNLEVVRLENVLIFQIDDESIPRIDTPNDDTKYSNIPGSLIALNF